MKDEKNNKTTSKIEEVEWKVIEKLANNKIVNNANNHLNKQATLKSNTNKKTEYTNFVAKKFDLVILIMKVLGYSVAVIMALINAFGIGIWLGIFVAIATWLSTLILEAVAEGLQLLEDIKNK